MAGHVPPTFEGNLVRPGSFPGYQQRHSAEVLEHKMAKQDVEIERFTRENRRLAATHVALRHELHAAQEELHKLQAHIGSIQTESDIQIRILMDKMAKMRVDIRASEGIRKELHKSHQEAKILIMTRQELSSQIQHANQELQKARSEVKVLPELHAELNRLRQEHQKLRVTFESEKGSNIELVQRLQAMENEMMGMAGEVERLRAEVAHTENRSHAPNPYAVSFGNRDPYAPPYGAPPQPDPYAAAYGAHLPPPPPDPYGAPPPPNSYAAPYGAPPPPNPYAAPYGAPPAPHPYPAAYGAPPPPPDPYAAPPPPPPPHGVSYNDDYGRHQLQVGPGQVNSEHHQHGTVTGASATGVASGGTGGSGAGGGTAAVVGVPEVNSGANSGWNGSNDAAASAPPPPPPPVTQR